VTELDPATADSLVGWQQVAGGWARHREFVWDASREVGELLVQSLDPQPGETILELAAGPGDTGFLAAARIGDTGRLLSTDFSSQMVATATARSGELGLTNVEHLVVDAQAIDLPDASIDGVLCRWGYMLMPDPQRALEETRRVLRHGGRLAFSVWADASLNPWASTVGRTVVELGFTDPPEPDTPGPFRLGDVEQVRAVVEAAGFEPAVITDVPVVWRNASFEEFWEIVRDISYTLSAALTTLEPDEIAVLKGRVEENLGVYTAGDGTLTMPGLTRNVLTRAPAA
jgi:SAM-dependent methyltransferase